MHALTMVDHPDKDKVPASSSYSQITSLLVLINYLTKCAPSDTLESPLHVYRSTLSPKHMLIMEKRGEFILALTKY